MRTSISNQYCDGHKLEFHLPANSHVSVSKNKDQVKISTCLMPLHWLVHCAPLLVITGHYWSLLVITGHYCRNGMECKTYTIISPQLKLALFAEQLFPLFVHCVVWVHKVGQPYGMRRPLRWLIHYYGD